MSAPLLLTDGTVIVHVAQSTYWYRLTPDNTGRYVNGSWSEIASLSSGYGPLYFASAVLPDGRLIINGGEYNVGSSTEVWTNLGAIYDPLADLWTACRRSPAPTTGTVAKDATMTYTIVATGTGNISFDPANNRLFLRPSDPGGVLRGATDVAVQTN